MKRLVLASLILTTSLVAQEIKHAPTAAQCQADQRLWDAEIGEGDSPKLPTFDILRKWSGEMDDCQKVDPDNVEKYANATSAIDILQATRMVRFLRRNGLWQKFIEEDAAGKR